MKKYYNPFIYYCLFILAIAVINTSCVNLKKTELMQKKAILSYSEEVPNAIRDAYKINIGDQLYIKIFSTDPKTSKLFQADFPELMTTNYVYLNSYKVDEDGSINFSFLGKMQVKGLTLIDAQTSIQKSLTEFFKDVNVFVKLVNFNITVLGDVRSPGTIVVDKDEITIFQALGKVGGFTDYSYVEKVTLIRKSPNGSIVKEIDLTDNGILKSDYFFLLPDDVIYVATRKSKPFIFDKFPYGVAFTILTTGLALYAIYED